MKQESIQYLVMYRALSAKQRTQGSHLPPVSLWRLADYIESKSSVTLMQRICSNLTMVASLILSLSRLILIKLKIISPQSNLKTLESKENIWDGSSKHQSLVHPL